MMQTAQSPQQNPAGMVRALFDSRPANGLETTVHRPSVAPEPDPEPKPGPDSVSQVAGGIIRPADWDAMFRAIQARLEYCVSDALLMQPELALHERHELTKTAVLECVEAMKQLHAALTLERRQSH